MLDLLHRDETVYNHIVQRCRYAVDSKYLHTCTGTQYKQTLENTTNDI